MKASITLSGFKRIGTKLLAILFWLLLWEITARLVDIRFIFPTVTDVIISLAASMVTASFWVSIGMTLLRISLGFIIGVTLGMIFALLSLVPAVHALMQPIITVIRSIPVASFIMMVWLLLAEPFIPTMIALLIVFPVVWQNAYDAATNPPRELDELAEVYRLSRAKKLLYLTFPTVLKGTLPAIITASGLAWKSGVAAEIITYTEHSIGRNIAEAKNILEGADLFAWTAVVIIFSLIVEAVIKICSRKAAKIWEY